MLPSKPGRHLFGHTIAPFSFAQRQYRSWTSGEAA